ncbi:MAG: ComEC/Rec2 family competence protein [Hyphomonadaceae bacterium]|nr:ComEC/Rec2 family competence protein [Hyphomonadaceae bacterium]
MTSSTDPPVWAGFVFLAVGSLIAAGFAFWPSETPTGIWRRALAGCFSLLAAFGLGLGAAQLRVWSVAQPPIPASEEPRGIEGWVVAVEPSESGPRLRLLVSSIEAMDATPRYVRVSVPEAGLLTPGRGARCFGVIGPPPGPMAPGAYDFARRAYFERLGATGFAFGRCRPAELAPPSWLDQQRLRLAALRSDLAAAIQSSAPGRGGAIAAALVAGDRSHIDQATNEVLQDSGLGHLLSVSGIHMAVVGGLVFGALIWTLSLIGPIALRFPVKKIAALGALVVLGAYLLISGSSVPALRAYVMAGVAFGAILLDRPAISMRGLALAAFIVVIIFPESVIEPGFQMSFAATMALVALFEMLRRAPHEPDLPTPGPLIGALQSISRGIGGVIGVSLVAGLATDPFAIYHFQRFAIYSLAANLVTAPIVSFIVAPAAAIAAVLAPFGWAELPLNVMASGLDLVAAIGETFGARPEAVRALPKPPDMAFILCIVALLWACLWRGNLRWGGLLLFVGALALYATAPRPVAAFDGDLRAAFMRAEEGGWRLISSGRSTYARERLGSMLGLSPAEVERTPAPETCSESGCVVTLEDGRILSIARDDAALAQACARGGLIVTKLERTDCAATLISGRDLAANGGALIYADRLERATPAHINRPWSARRHE